MRDVHAIEGKKQYVETIDVALALVRQKYPAVTKEGCVGAYGFYLGEQIVAEAWIHLTKPGWWLRIKK